MTLLAGSITVLHTIYANLIAKQTQIQKAHDEIIERSNQYEIAMAREFTLRHAQTEKNPDLHSLSRGQTK